MAKKAEGKDTVTIRLFKDNGRYKGDEFVGYNGTFYKIQRGVEVEVPLGVAEIIEQSLKQDQATQDAIQRITKG